MSIELLSDNQSMKYTDTFNQNQNLARFILFRQMGRQMDIVYAYSMGYFQSHPCKPMKFFL